MTVNKRFDQDRIDLISNGDCSRGTPWRRMRFVCFMRGAANQGCGAAVRARDGGGGGHCDDAAAAGGRDQVRRLPHVGAPLG